MLWIAAQLGTRLADSQKLSDSNFNLGCDSYFEEAALSSFLKLRLKLYCTLPSCQCTFPKF
jgi:hypothetical protein